MLNKNDREKASNKNKAKTVRWVFGCIFALLALTNGFHYSSLLLWVSAFLMLPLTFVEAFLKKKSIKTSLIIILSVCLLFAGVLSSPSSETPDLPLDDPEQRETDIGEESEKTPATESNEPKESTEIEIVETPEDTLADNGEPTEPVIQTTPVEPDVTTTLETEPVEPDITTMIVTEPVEPDVTTSIVTETDTPMPEEPKVQMVWIPSSGTKYHSRSSCSNMKSPRQVTLEYALAHGYTDCSKC